MQHRDGRLVVSPTDLAEFLRSRFACWMTRAALERPELRPGRDAEDPESLPDVGEILKQRGFEHEARVLAKLRDAGRDVVELAVHGDDSHARTLEAMRAGREVIFQAHLARPPFAGVADFLVRVPGASELGDFHYEVWDAKLARHVRPTHVIQLCCYADMLEAVQGVRPGEVQVVLGDGREKRLRLAEFFYFHRALRRELLAFLEAWRADAPPFPDPAADHGAWQEEADRRLAASDHVMLVAGCTAAQAKKLAKAGIETASQLADATAARISGMDERIFAKLCEQARLQRDSAGLASPRFRVLDADDVEEGKGFAMLPPASAGDVCFDLEGDPLEVDGLEYLWGVTYRDDAGALAYRDWWAHDRAGERSALESFLDWLAERRARFPDLHVFHYAPYETAVLKRLAGREGTREDLLDDLLRSGVFVDLFSVVRHGLRVGEPRYSLKNVERLYRGARTGEVASGMESVVAYDAWRQSGEPRDAAASPLLRRIRDYNEEDCRSTSELLDWLRARQHECGIAFRPKRPDEEQAEEKSERAIQRAAERAERQALAARLLAEIPPSDAERAGDPERWTVQELLAQMLEYHHREARPVWWELFARAEQSVEERYEQIDCLAGLVRTERAPFAIKKSLGFEYRYDPAQDTKIGEGSECALAQHPFLTVEVYALEPDTGVAVLKVTEKALAKAGLAALPDALCLIEFKLVPTETLERSLTDLARTFEATHDVSPVVRDLLLRRPPRIRGQSGKSVRHEGESAADALVRAVAALDSSVLCVQGPPGSGKTTSSARAICALLRAGKKVGIACNSHAAIANLMRACADENGGALDCVKVDGKPGTPEVPTFSGCEHVPGRADVASYLDRVSLIGGTAWCFSRPELRGRLDCLFVDEASQVSLANVVAMSRAARNLVLVGDQMQLSQPTRAVHPGESGRSALDYALGGATTIPDERGLFLETTHRLHPTICEYVSGAFYEDRLQPAPGNERRVLRASQRSDGALAALEAGLVFVPVPHTGNTQCSDEEAAAVRALVAQLVGRRHTDREGKPAGEIGLDDILVVAPYNAQVRTLEHALPPRARIGTVDRFQGQQAPVVVVSMCASEPALSPRGIGFLFHPNRLNVAVSRAQCLALVVGAPALATPSCRSVDEMRLVNRMCRLLEHATAAA
ncbi:MAG: helicase [Proteobacteria bacterium]|nr:MAG: helicase [Pseudomonadota bacterium]